MGDITIIPDRLQNTLVQLIKDNNDILETIKKINDSIKLMDESVWSSPEKTKMDNELIPYIDSRYMVADVTLNNCTSVINMALEKYVETNNIILEKNETLEDYRNTTFSKSSITIGDASSDSTNREVL